MRKKKNKAQAIAVEDVFFNEEKINGIVSSPNPKEDLEILLADKDITQIIRQYLKANYNLNKDFEQNLKTYFYRNYVDALKESLSFLNEKRLDFLNEEMEFKLPELIGDYFQKCGCEPIKKFERLVASKFPDIFIEKVRAHRAFLQEKRFAFYTEDKDLQIPVEHLETWKLLKDQENKLWAKVEDSFRDYISENSNLASVPEQFCTAMIEIIVWMEEKRWKETDEIRGLLQECYNLFVEKYCRDCGITTLDFTERSAEEELIRQWGYIIEKKNTNAANNLFEAIFSWVSFKNGILDPYCYDMSFKPKRGEKGTLLLSQSPKDYYRWVLDGFRYEKNRNLYSKEGGDFTDLTQDLFANNDEINLVARDRFTATQLFLEDLCLDKINWNEQETKISEVFKPLIGLSTNRLYLYEKQLEVLKQQGIKTWTEAYVKLTLDNLKQYKEIKASPFNIYTKEQFILQTKEVGFHESTVNLDEELFNLFCFKFNDNSFDRFNKRSYDVMSKPFLEIGENIFFSPTMFMANNDWFYGSAEKVMEMYNKVDEKTRKDNSTQMEQKIADLFKKKGWETECFHDGDKKIKGDVDIIVKDKNTVLLIQLKRTMFRTTPSEQYLEIVNVDGKASYQLNAYRYNENDKKVVRWYVTNSYESCLKEFVSKNGKKCTKVNYFDLINLLESSYKCDSISDLIKIMTEDCYMRELYLNKDNRPFLGLQGMISPIVQPEKAYEIVLKTDDTKTQEKLNGILDKNGKDIEERLKIAVELSETNFDNYLVWDILADIYTDKEEFGKAIKCCKKALELLPNDPFLLRNYAITLRKERESHLPLILAQSKEERETVKTLMEQYWFLDLDILTSF